MRPHWLIAATIAAAGLLVLPLWVAGTPAMPDYPARLAGFFLIGGGHSAFYSIVWAPIPNLASEIIVPLLARLMPLEVAAKLFLSAALAMWVAGPTLIYRALFGRMGLAPLAAPLFAYNVNFMWGFFNYYFAAGLCLIAFAGWIASRNRPRVPRLVFFAAATVVLYFCHILAAGLFLFLAAAFEAAQRPLPWRRSLTDLAILAAPVAVLYLLKPGASLGGDMTFNILNSFPRRLESLVQSGFASPAYFTMAALAGLFAFGAWRGAIRLHPQMRLALMGIAIVAFLAPETAMQGWGLHLRFPAIAASLLFASSEVAVSRKVAASLIAGALAGMGWVSFAAAGEWRNYDAQIAEFRAALGDVPRHARLMTAIDNDGTGEVPDRIYWHIAEYAIIDRDAFTALMFATKGQHIVSVDPSVGNFAAHTAREGVPPKLSELAGLAAGDGKVRPELRYLQHFPCHFDEVVLIHPNGGPQTVPPMLKLRHEGSFFALYDLRRDPRCSTISATRP